jgi:hypothetical protein
MQACVIIAAISAPAMLLIKPIILGCCSKHHKEVNETEMTAINGSQTE